MTGRSTINDGLHNPVGSFHGPHPEKTDRKKKTPSSTTPHRPDSSAYFMLIYWVRGWELLLVNDAGQRNQTPPQVLMRRYSNLFTVYENHTAPITFKSAPSIQERSLRADLTRSF